jgi:hypothetical protein
VAVFREELAAAILAAPMASPPARFEPALLQDGTSNEHCHCNSDHEQ